jgi:hypothetical protein
MENEIIRRIVTGETRKHLQFNDPRKVHDLEESLIGKLNEALGKSDVRTSCLRECWEKWLESKDEKDFLRWLLGQLA